MSLAKGTKMIEVYVKESGKVWFGVANEAHQIFATAFADTQQRVIRYLLRMLPFDVPFEITYEGTPLVDRIISLIEDVYFGKDTKIEWFCLVDKQLKPYTRMVLQTVSHIPPGFITSYGAVAKVVGGGARAVGNIMAANPFPPLVPCHRVVKSNFKLGGYGVGANVKLEILKREKKGYTEPKKISIGEKLLQIFPVEFVLNRNSRTFYS
ncbi:MAG: MGMT family protein [Candidatus Bathyarchaeota archaeon]|nr:MGMT family protein [Candidatus Bathyarchaeota archaeon]